MRQIAAGLDLSDFVQRAKIYSLCRHSTTPHPPWSSLPKYKKEKEDKKEEKDGCIPTDAMKGIIGKEGGEGKESIYLLNRMGKKSIRWRIRAPCFFPFFPYVYITIIYPFFLLSSSIHL